MENGSPPSTSLRTAACRTSGCGPTSAEAFPTGSALTPTKPSGTEMFNKRCVRVHEGGQVLQTIQLDRGCFACMLGGTDNRTLFMIVAEWRGMQHIPDVARARTGQVLTAEAPAPGVGW